MLVLVFMCTMSVVLISRCIMDVGTCKGVPWMLVLVYKCTMAPGVGAYIQMYHGCWCFYSCVPWVWVLVYRCTMRVDTYKGVH